MKLTLCHAISDSSAKIIVLSAPILLAFGTGNVSAQESFRNGAKTTEAAASLLLPVQMPQEDTPPDKAVIAIIKKNKSIDFRKLFPSNWEAVCFSGQYQDPISDVNYSLGKNFTSCHGKYHEFRDDGLQAITIVWNNQCRVIEVNTSDFYIESQNGTSCYRRESASEFSLQQWPVGTILAPSE